MVKYIISPRHIGDFFIECIFHASVNKNPSDLIFFVQPGIVGICKQIVLFLGLNSKVYSIHDQRIKEVYQLVELNPLKRSVPPLIRIIKLTFICRYKGYLIKSIDCKKDLLHPKYIYTLFQYFILRFVYKLSLIKTTKQHIFDILIATGSKFYGVNQKILKNKLIYFRDQFLDTTKKGNDKYSVVIIPEVGSPKEKGLNHSELNELIKKYPNCKIAFFKNQKRDKEEISFSDKIIHYASLNDLADILINSRLVIACDSFPAHLSIFLNRETYIFAPGYDYGRFFPYPEWFIKSDVKVFDKSLKLNCFNCGGCCRHHYACMEWKSVIKDFLL
tara:strand:- start:607 stop:1599 length:993 start_codon:yes stop_codon:yes gene_type:complete